MQKQIFDTIHTTTNDKHKEEVKMLKIKDIKHLQVFYGIDDNGEFYSFKAWGDPVLVDGVWTIEAEDCGNYSYTFTENDEIILFLDESLD